MIAWVGVQIRHRRIEALSAEQLSQIGFRFRTRASDFICKQFISLFVTSRDILKPFYENKIQAESKLIINELPNL